jgi:hypothetical protein
MTSRMRTVLVTCIATWAVAALWSGYRDVAELPNRVHQARLDEISQRQTTWSPISGFAQACATSLPNGTGVTLMDITDRTLVTDPATRTGPAAFGAPDDVDWPNQAAFAYAIYPRSVVSLGHLPPAFQVVDVTTPYIALWEQAAYRSSAARADSVAAHQQLSNSPQVGLICSYSDRLSNSGSIFATKGSVAPVPRTVQAPQSLAGIGVASTMFGLGILWAIGALILGALGIRKSWPGLWAAAALPMGCVAVTVQMLTLSIAGVRWSLAALLIPWIVIASVIAWRRPTWMRQLLTWRFTLPRFDRYEIAALAGLVVSIVLVAGSSPLALPQSDGFNLYYFKANAFFTDGSVVPYYKHAAEFLYSFPAHPPLIPLSVTWLYLFIGQVQERSTLLLWPALYVSLLGTLYALVRTRTSRKQALWYVLFASFVAFGLRGEATGSGYTDMPLAVFLLLGAGCLWLWVGYSRGAGALVAAGGVFLGAALLTKEEGLLDTMAALAAMLLLTWNRSKFRWGVLWPGLGAGAIALAVASIWMAVRLAYRLPNLTVDLGAKLDFVGQRLLPAITGLGLRAAPQLMLAVIVIAGVILVRRRDPSFGQIFDRRFQFLAAMVLLMLAGDVLGLALAPLEIHYQVSVTASRLVMQAMPLILLALVEPWRHLVEATPSIQSNRKGNSAPTNR